MLFSCFGLAGAGKSAASVEVSKWYEETDPNTQTLLFTSFETGPTLAEAISTAEPTIGTRVKGLDLYDASVQGSIIRVLTGKRTLWVWDNVETISGMDEAERQRFLAFVQRANQGGLKLLLTARDTRHEQWRVLFSGVLEDFVGPDLEALPGCDKWWTFIMDHRLRIAMEHQDLDQAEPMARLIETYEEKQTAASPKRSNYQYNPAQRKALLDLAIATGRLADVLRLKEDAECLAMNEEALAIYKVIGNKTGTAIRELNLGHCYKNVPSIHDFAAAEAHYRIAYDNYPTTDALPRAQCLAQISMTWLEQIEQHGLGRPLTPKLRNKLAGAIEQYEQAFDGIPPDAWGDLANLHNNVANALRFDPDRRSEAVDHLRSAHQYAMAAGRFNEAAVMRANLAPLFGMMKRHEEAVAVAEQALHELEAVGVDNGQVRQLKRIIRSGV